MSIVTVVLLHDVTSSEPVSVVEVLTAPEVDVTEVELRVKGAMQDDGTWNDEMWVEVVRNVPLV